MLEHGGNLRAAALRFGRDVADWIDLSAGLNPHWYPAPPLDGNAWHRLPEADPALAQAACDYYGTPATLAVAGTQAAIQALPPLRAGLHAGLHAGSSRAARVVVAAPSYAEHAHHWAMHGHSMRQVPYDELEAALPDCDVMVLCNPNNPTGATVPPQKLLEWAAHLEQRGGWLVVDEAFADMTPGTSVAAWSGRPGLIVLRSVGKFFGLAGVRTGFVCAHPELLAKLADALGPWTVSGPAQRITCAALRDFEWQSRMRERLIADGMRLRLLLAGHGIASSGSALFQWWPEARAEAFWRHMAERGIWVRLFPQAARGIRLGLPPNEDAWQRLERALNEWTKEQS